MNPNSAATNSETCAQPSIAERIDRLPLGRFHRRFIATIALGIWFDFYDIFSIAYIGAALQDSGFLTLHQFSVLVASGFLGMFAGTIVFGVGSDRIGRRSAFVFMLLIYSIFTFASALAPSPNWLIVFRFFAGAGVGAENVVVDTYVTEITPSHARGRYVAVTQVVGFTAVPAAAFFSRWLVPTHFLMAGWRWVMLIGSFGALLAWNLRRSLPESPRWLEARGRLAEAEASMLTIESERFERPASRAKSSVHTPRTESTAPAIQPLSFAELWRPPYLRRVVMLIIFQALQTLGFYGFANWAPTFILKQGATLVTSLDYSLLIALVSPVGPIIGATTSDRLERKWTLAGLALAIAASGLGFSVARSGLAIVATGASVTILIYWFSAAFHAYQSELFPTRSRATGVGFTYSWSRLSAAVSSLVIGAVLTRGVVAVFILISLAMVAVAVVVTILGPRTNKRVLEEISR